MLSILILCTGNSARSILGEFILNHDGRGLVQAYSAGSHPTGRPNPFALQTLRAAGINADTAASKSWDVFAGDKAPVLDLVITVCDNAAGEICPLFHGRGAQPAKVHWGYPDPAGVEGSDADKAQAFAATFQALRQRIQKLLALQALSPLEDLPVAERAALVQAIAK